jgi:hypothetical protein
MFMISVFRHCHHLQTKMIKVKLTLFPAIKRVAWACKMDKSEANEAIRILLY